MRALETKVGHFRFVYVFVSKHSCIVGVVLHPKELIVMNHKLLETTKNATLVLFYGWNMFFYGQHRSDGSHHVIISNHTEI